VKKFKKNFRKINKMPLEEDVSSESSAESSDEQVYLDLNGRMSKIQFIFNQYNTCET
jgi:hypothetical protein